MTDTVARTSLDGFHRTAHGLSVSAHRLGRVVGVCFTPVGRRRWGWLQILGHCSLERLGVLADHRRLATITTRTRRHRRRIRRGVERGTRGPSPGRSSAEPVGQDPRSGSCSEAGSWVAVAAGNQHWYVDGSQSRQEAAVWDPPRANGVILRRAVSQVVGRSRSCCLADVRFNASCPACLLVGDPVKNTSRYASGFGAGLPTAPMTSGAHPCMAQLKVRKSLRLSRMSLRILSSPIPSIVFTYWIGSGRPSEWGKSEPNTRQSQPTTSAARVTFSSG